jgi:peptide-methionine (S)-S-oxide reductase
MKIVALVLALVLTGGLMLQSARAHRPKPELKTATFAGGCFWGVQAAFDRVPGIVSTEAGYTGGTDMHPTHMSVAIGDSGDVEAVRVTYDARQVSYAELLDVFWSCHDPTLDLSTGPNEGPGRSMIFVNDPLQDRLAHRSLDEVNASAVYPARIATQIVPAKAFYRAEAEHQHFADRNGAAVRCETPGPAIHTQVAACARHIRMGY